MKKIYHARIDCYETKDFFFDESYHLLHWWDVASVNFQEEYMQGLFRSLGFDVEEVSYKDERFYQKIKDVLTQVGKGNEVV